VRLEGLGQLKYLMTSSGIELATFRLVAKCLNQLRYRVHPTRIIQRKNIIQWKNIPVKNISKLIYTLPAVLYLAEGLVCSLQQKWENP
jgi:hypothetical protein